MKIPQSSLVVSAILAGVVFVGAGRAATIFQTVNSGSDSQTWGGALWGTPAATPTAGNDYISDGAVTPSLRTGNFTNSTFAGDSLTLRNGASLVIKTTNVTAKIILESGGTLGMSENGTNILTSSGSVAVAGGQTGVFGSGDSGRRLVFDAKISGAGTISIAQGTSTSGYTGEVILRNAANDFSGTWEVTGGILTNFAIGSVTPAAQAFGAADFVVKTNGILDIRSNFGGPSTTTSLTLQSGGLFDLSNGFSYTFETVTIGGTVLTAGTYAYADLAPSLQGYFIAGSDSITVLSSIPEPSTFAWAGGLVALVAAGLRRRR